MLNFPLAWAQNLSYEEALTDLENTPQMILALLQLESAQKNLEVSSSLFQGEASLGYSQTWGEKTSSDQSNPEDLGNSDWEGISVSGRINVIPYGPHAESVQRARWQLEQAELNVRDERASTIITVTEQYQNALFAKKTWNIEQKTLELAELQLEAVTTQFESGAANETQRLQAELSLKQAEEGVRSAEQSFIQALQALSVTLGQSVTDVSGALTESRRPVNERPLEARADIINAATSVQDAEITVMNGLRQALPSASLSLNYGLSPEEGRFDLGARIDTNSYQPTLSASYDPDFNMQQNAQTFRLDLSLSIPVDVSVASALEAANLSLKQSELREAQTRELALLDIASKEAQANSAEVQVVLSQERRNQQETLLEAIQARFDAGLVSMLELKQAELDVLNSQLSLVQSQNALRVAHMNLAVAYAMNPLEVYP